MYAHNGGKFDWHFLLDDLEPWEPIMVIAGRLAKFKIGKAEFRDSYNLMPMPLAAYKKDDIDYSIMEPDVRELSENMAKIRKYLQSDCEYLFELLSLWIEEFGMHLTLAGASMKAYERISGRDAPKTSESFYKVFDPYYYGGRVECFETGEINREFRIVDINSAYPHAMMSEHPTGDTWSESKFLPVTDSEISRSFIRLRATAQGAFPYRGRDNSLGFPADGTEYVFTVTGWEYLAARDTGTLGAHSVHSCITLSDTVEFSDYLNHFYEMKNVAKRQGDKARYEFAKRFLNSLYGKHGANPENYDEYTIVSPSDQEYAEFNDGYQFCAHMGKWALVSRPLAEEKRRYYNVATAASITGFVRAMLWRAICQAKGVIYCDTDAIMCDDPGSLDLHPERLGAWDVEAVCSYGAIAAKKLYAVKTHDVDDNGAAKWKTACKGVRLTADEIVRVSRGETLIYSPPNPTFSLKSGVRFTPRQVRRATPPT